MTKKRIGLIVLLALLAIPIALTIAVFVSANRPPPALVLGPIVQTHEGQVQGAIVEDVVVYRGIPFATPPLAQLRWRAPEPVKPWSGVLQAIEFKPACMQSGPPLTGDGTRANSEDCLYLNLWAPSDTPQHKLPVMVYLHGGGGVMGSPSSRAYWGDALVRRGVITVNVSYRVGVFGWLAHPDLSDEASYHASGNYAVLDMIAGLKWVQESISAFGGDPNNVTLFGQSAGAFNASRLMTSPLASGLFHKVIGQSGGDFHPAGTKGGNMSLADAEAVGVEFASTLGASTINALRAMPAEAILNAPLPKSQTRLPIIDGYVTLDDNQSLYGKSKQLKIPLLVGYNEIEGAALGDPSAALAPTDASTFIAYVKEQYGAFGSKLLEHYPATTDGEAMRSYLRLTGEQAINWNTVTWAQLHAATGQSDVYFYYFSKRPPMGPLRRIGAAHGAELPYVFGFVPAWMRLFTQWPRSARHDLQLINRIPAYWTNFAKTGDPNSPELPNWPAFNVSRHVLHFGETETSAIPLPAEAEHNLIDDYFEYVAGERESNASNINL